MNLYSRLAEAAETSPDRTAVETAQRRLTYADVDLTARRIAAALRARGVGAGDLVGLHLHDTPEHVAALFALMRVGAVMLPFDWRATQAEFDRLAGQFPPKAIVTDDAPMTGREAITVDMDQALRSPPDTATPAALENAPMGYGLTSGTTGAPKAFVVTHEQLRARCAIRAGAGVFDKSDRYLSTLPLAYTAGREHAICALLQGATLAMMPSLFSPRELVDFVNGRGITAVSLSPNVSRALIAAARNGPMLMPGLRTLVSTTGKLQPEDRAAILESVAPRLVDYYGSTGTGPIAAITRPADGTDGTAAGRPMPGVTVEVAGDDGMRLPDGEIGRIRVRGDNVSTLSVGAAMTGDEAFRDGWYYPGDLGSFAPDGVLNLHGRTTELIKRGGLSVHAQEVEQALRRHECVADAAVAGVASDLLGEEVIAYVVAACPVDEKALIRHCRRELVSYKVPARIVFLAELPRNATGKVVKRLLPPG